MNTQNKMTPLEAGLSLKVLSGPIGTVQDDWQRISYQVALYKGACDTDEPKPFITTEYHLGIGHVNVNKLGDVWNTFNTFSESERAMINAWQKNPMAQFVNKKLQFQIAAEIAKIQKVVPSLDDVIYSLLSDGSAFFDAESFEDWASNFGDDTDSRKAEKIYLQCMETGRKLASALDSETLVRLREWASEY